MSGWVQGLKGERLTDQILRFSLGHCVEGRAAHSIFDGFRWFSMGFTRFPPFSRPRPSNLRIQLFSDVACFLILLTCNFHPMSSPTATLHDSSVYPPPKGDNHKMHNPELAPPLALDLSTAEKGGLDFPNEHPISRLPTLKDIRGDPSLMETRRQRSRTLSVSGKPKDLALNRALSRISNPFVSRFVHSPLNLRKLIESDRSLVPQACSGPKWWRLTWRRR